jgi:hypothetical protein
MTLRSGNRLFTITSLGMEISWRFVWANFLFLSIFHHHYPWKDAVGAFLIAAILMAWPSGRGWRKIYLVLFQIIGLALACLHIIYVFHGVSQSPDVGFWSMDWPGATFAPSQSALVWLPMIFKAVIAAVFWFGGMNWARRERSYDRMILRFDFGLSAFFLLFIVKWLLRMKFAVEVHNDGALMLMITFFTFGLPAMALARTHSRAVREYQAGFRRMGVVLSFAALAVLLGVGSMTFFLPQLTATAELGYRALTAVAEPLGPVAVAILRFLFAPRRGPAGASSGGGMAQSPEIPTDAEAPWWADIFTYIVGWGGAGLIILAGLAVALYFLYQLWKWLMSQTPQTRKPKGWRAALFQWLDGLNLIWQFISEWLKNNVRRRNDPVALYAGLVQWGRRSGIYRLTHETPREYGLRLANAFPMAEGDITAIVRALETSVYAEQTIETLTMDTIRSGWKRLGRPALWPLRVKVRFLYQM